MLQGFRSSLWEGFPFHCRTRLLLVLLLSRYGEPGLWEWKDAAKTGKEYAIGDPPPRAPRLPPNVTCSFGGNGVPCVAAHNYFADFDPVVSVTGTLELWSDDACDGSGGGSDSSSSSSSSDGRAVIVVVRRGGCAFGTKVKNLMAVGRFGAVLIIDYPLEASASQAAIPLPDPPSLGEERGVDIPVAMLTHAGGDIALRWGMMKRDNRVELVSATRDSLKGE